MTEQKKNPVTAIVFLFFLVVMPIVTVCFSKYGLDKYKDYRGEMQFLKDSIRIDFNQMDTYWDSKLDNEFIRGKLVLVAFWDKACNESIDEVVDSLKAIQSYFNKDDQRKMLFILHAEDYTQDSTWALKPYVAKWGVDTSAWKFSKSPNWGNYRVEAEDRCRNIVMLDGRVSRKDDTENYKKGPLLCDYYNIKDQRDIEAMLKHMALIMPKKSRKSIEYKANKKLY